MIPNDLVGELVDQLSDGLVDAGVEDRRGASEVVAVALLIGIVVLGVTAVLLIGGPALAQAQESVEVGQAEQALVQFDSESYRVATGGTTTQQVDLGLRVNAGTLDVENDSGRMTVEYVNLSDNVSTEVMNTTMGAVVYENGDTSVAYQGGGVWRSDGNGSVMVSPPEISYRGETLTMPVVRSHGGSVYSEVQMSRTGSRERFPDAAAGLTNKLSNAQIRIVVQSRYYRAWGAYFEAEANTVVRYDDRDQRAIIVFFALPSDFSPDAGVIATSGPGRLQLAGTGAYVDSYNSSRGQYASSQSEEGIVEAAGDVITTGNSEIDGDVRAGRDIDTDGSSVIDGNATANGNVTANGPGQGTVTGDVSENGSYVISEPPVDRLVSEKVRDIRARNDNAETPVVTDDDELRVTAGNDTLPPGRYYFEEFDLQGETLVLNATGGDIAIAVEDWVRLKDDARIEVRGNGTVRLFVGSGEEVSESIPGGGQVPGGIQNGVHFVAKYNATVDVPGDRSHQFQVYGPRHFEGAISGSNAAGNHPSVTAAIVVPAGATGSGQFYVHQGDLYGAVVTGNLTLGQYGQAHFDRGLLDAELLLGQSFARLDYLYLTEYEIEARSS